MWLDRNRHALCRARLLCRRCAREGVPGTMANAIVRWMLLFRRARATVLRRPRRVEASGTAARLDRDGGSFDSMTADAARAPLRPAGTGALGYPSLVLMAAAIALERCGHCLHRPRRLAALKGDPLPVGPSVGRRAALAWTRFALRTRVVQIAERPRPFKQLLSRESLVLRCHLAALSLIPG